MIGNRIKKLLERIHKASDDEGGVYVVTLRDGVYTCHDPEMACTSEEEFLKWQDTLNDDDGTVILMGGRRDDRTSTGN